ncbi:MAG: ribosome small subunit-dependent GTPase A [Spirochaetaceae bacterium]|jgi:ribosome biogenesis GTPase|nr:ribosome small subunit-dependent GTPase A [Spirochaetaceae bacterium]
MKGVVIKGSRNIFLIKSFDTNLYYECPIKGKILKCTQKYYNPLAPGDIVCFEQESPGKGMVTNVEQRRNFFTRFNRKGLLPQILASNIDRILCVTTPAAPPFRPRFIDRVLLQAEAARIPAFLVMNKTDLIKSSCINQHGDKTERNTADHNNEIEERMADYMRIGYKVMYVSAASGEGINELRSAIANTFSVFIGQSGVGKSSLINALFPNTQLKTGVLNEKYDRGNHTTVQSQMIEFKILEDVFQIVDTPGVRQFVPDGVKTEHIMLYMKEFAPLAGKCGFGLSCSHRKEARCAILNAVETGMIRPERYDSFLRIQSELNALKDRK